MIEFDLNTNDCEALLRHCEALSLRVDDPRGKRRLLAGLEALREALIKHLPEPPGAAEVNDMHEKVRFEDTATRQQVARLQT